MAILKDSGERREFGTGAVRDMAEGKGRCDLLPIEVVASFFYNDSIDEVDRVIDSLKGFDEGGRSDTGYLYDALAFLCKQAFWGDKADMMLQLSQHMEDGAKKYGENNWQKGIPVRSYLDSAFRHYFKWLRGDDDEPHHRACAWNLMCMIWELDHHPDQSVYEVE